MTKLVGIDFTARDLQAKLKAKGLKQKHLMDLLLLVILPKEQFSSLENLTFD
jgi:hypothetical protein